MNSITATTPNVETSSGILYNQSASRRKKKYERGSPQQGVYFHRQLGEEKPLNEWHKFSKSIAYRLNSTSPDLSGACILYGLSLWMKIGKAQRMSYCYRSLSQLAIQYPYLSEEGIRKAIHRLTAALRSDFKVLDEGKTLRFWVSELVMKEMDKGLKLMFRIKDAELHGIPSALLLSNLSWQFLPTWTAKDPFREDTSIRDNDGNKYYPLNPVVLTAKQNDEWPILPMSRWTITRCVKDLIKDGAMQAHPNRKNYYRIPFNLSSEKCPQLFSKLKGDGAKVASDGAKVADHGAKVADFPCVDSNEIVNADSKVFFPDTAPASPPPCGVSTSSPFETLKSICDQVIQDIRHQGTATTRITTVPASQIPYDVIRSPQYDLPYETIPLHPWTGRPYMRSHQVRDWMDEIAHGWRINGFRYTRKDLDAIADIFLHVHTFHLEHFEELSQHIGSWAHNILTGRPHNPPRKSEFDPFFFARKVKSAGTLVRYLPELITEMFSEVIYQPGETKEWENYDWVHGAFGDVLEYLRPPVIGNEIVPWDSNPTAEVPLCSREDYLRATA